MQLQGLLAALAKLVPFQVDELSSSLSDLAAIHALSLDIF